MSIVLKVGFLPKEIIFTGPGKTEEDLKYALTKRIRLIIVESGNEIDKKLYELMKEKVSGIQLTPGLSRKIKEEYGFVGEGQEKVNVDFYVDGRLETIDIADELKEACSIIIPEICDNIRELVVSFDPEYMGDLAKNIVLAGGCSQIKGLAHEIETNLSDLGSVRVNVIDDPIFAGAVGGLMLAQEMPFEEWEQV